MNWYRISKNFFFVAILFFTVISHNEFIEKVFAQTYDPQAISQGISTSVFSPRQRALESGSFTPQQKNLLRGLVNRAETAFITTFTSQPSTGSLADNYRAGINAAIVSIGTDQSANPQFQTGAPKNFIDTFQTLLGTEANNQEYIRAITTGTALSANAQAQSMAVTQASGIKDALQDPNACGLFNGNLLDCIGQLVEWVIKNTLLQVAGFALWLTANMMNMAIQVSIVNFAAWSPSNLYPIWLVIRQIISLFVVFAGLYLGFLYIIGDPKNKFQHYLPWVIIFALFVNFSYPVTRFVIDISNITSINIYTSVMGNDVISGNGSNTPGALILNRLGLQGLIASATDANSAATNNVTGSLVKSINSIPSALLAVVFVLYAAYIFFIVSALIIVRTVVLSFLVVASPLLFVDSVVPKLGDYAVKMRTMFFEQIIVAPIFMIMLALTLRFLEVFQNINGGVNLGSLNNGSGVAVFFNILMMLIMLNIMIKVTKNVSGKAGEMAGSFMGQVGGFGLGVATGGAGLLGRAVIGKRAALVRDSTWMQNNKDSLLGRSAFAMSNSLAKSSYDLRNSSVIAGGVNKLVSKGYLEKGMGVRGGSKANWDEMQANYEKKMLDRNNEISERYTKDILDPKTGAIIHRKGDINEGQVRAARELRRKPSYIFNKEAVREKLDEANLQRDKTNDGEKDKLIASYKQEYDAITTADGKTKYLADLQKQLVDVKRIDPNLAGTTARSLVEGVKKLQETHAKTVREMEAKTMQAVLTYTKADKKNRSYMSDDAKQARDKELTNKMSQVEDYLGIKNDISPGNFAATAKSKADALKLLNNPDMAREIIKNDPFTDLKEAQKGEIKEIEREEEALALMKRSTADQKAEYEEKRTQIAERKKALKDDVENLRTQVFQAYEMKLADSQQLQTAIDAPESFDIPAYLRNDKYREGIIPGETVSGPSKLQAESIDDIRKRQAEVRARLNALGATPITATVRSNDLNGNRRTIMEEDNGNAVNSVEKPLELETPEQAQARVEDPFKSSTWPEEREIEPRYAPSVNVKEVQVGSIDLDDMMSALKAVQVPQRSGPTISANDPRAKDQAVVDSLINGANTQENSQAA